MMTDYLTLINSNLNQGASILSNIAQTAQQQHELDERKRAALVDESIRQANSARADTATKLSVLDHGESADANNTVGRTIQAPTGYLGALAPQQSRMPVDPNRVVDFQGTRSYVPTADESTQTDLKNKVAAADAMKPYTHVEVSQQIADLAGIKTTSVPHGDLGHVFDAAAKAVEAMQPAAPPKPVPLHFQTGYDAQGNMNTVGRDPATGKVTMRDVQPGMKAPKVAGGNGIQDRFDQRELDRAQARDDAQQKLQDGGAKLHADLQLKEQEQHRLRAEYGQALTDTDTTKNDKAEQTIIDPKSAKEVVMNPARRKFYQQQIEAAGTKVADLQRQQGEIRKRYGMGEFAAVQGQGGPKPKLGDIQQHNGVSYKFNGREYVRQ